MITPKERVTVDHDPGLLGILQQLSPEQELVKAIIEEAMVDLFRVPCNADDTRPRDAWRWIFGRPIKAWRMWSFGDFEPACHALGIDPEALRAKLRRDLAMKAAS